ncbi:Early endosome antigen 1 isoform 5 [Schistosoma japonicum]|nr:Early endosome antigen 1 [Schistosoma japonicum]TNN09549.1 Early endosome antigen 1 isoform 5 [Schistosoma japonicum]
MVHFESSHANLPISIEKSSVKGECDGAYDKLDSYENLVAELTTHNLNLLNRVTDFEAVIHLLLNEAPLVDTSAIKDDELKKKVIGFLDYQTLLAKSHSSIKSIEEDLAKKNETISLLRKQVDELQANSGIMKTDASTYICVDTKGVQSQCFSEELVESKVSECSTQLSSEEDSLLVSEKLKSLLSENDSLKIELLSVRSELGNVTKKLNETVSSTKDEIHKYETELTNRSTYLSILEGQLQELKLTNKKLTDDSSTLILIKENSQLELKRLKSEFETKLEQYVNEINRLTNELTESQSLYSTLQEKYKQLQTEADDAIKLSQISKEKLASLEKNLMDIRSESQSQSTLSKKEIDSLMEKLINAEDTNHNLRNELNCKQKELKELQIAVIELGRENQILQVLRDRLTNRQWTKDDEALTCFSCNCEFSLSTRRHHCRNCGGIFCQHCSSNRASTTFSKDPVRVCQMCYKELTDNS